MREIAVLRYRRQAWSIRLTSRKEMRSFLSPHERGRRYGLCIFDERLILIADWVAPYHRWGLLVHELIHAVEQLSEGKHASEALLTRVQTLIADVAANGSLEREAR